MNFYLQTKTKVWDNTLRSKELYINPEKKNRNNFEGRATDTNKIPEEGDIKAKLENRIKATNKIIFCTKQKQIQKKKSTTA